MHTVADDYRKLSTQEKKMLGTALGKLSSENLYRALEIVAETNSMFQPGADEVDLDLDAQVSTVNRYLDNVYCPLLSNEECNVPLLNTFLISLYYWLIFIGSHNFGRSHM